MRQGAACTPHAYDQDQEVDSMQATGGERRPGLADVSRAVQPWYGDQSALPREGRSDQWKVRPPIAAGGARDAKADRDQPKASPASQRYTGNNQRLRSCCTAQQAPDLLSCLLPCRPEHASKPMLLREHIAGSGELMNTTHTLAKVSHTQPVLHVRIGPPVPPS